MSLRLRNPLKLLRSNAVALDMGTGQTRVARPEGDLLLDAPTVIAIDQHSDAVLATGPEAKSFLGKAPERIRVVRPLEAGVIRDMDAARLLLSRFLAGILPTDGTRIKATVVAPQGVSELEKKSLADCCRAAGISRVDLVSAPLAAAIGAGLDVAQPKGRLLLGIGEGLAEASVVSLGGIIQSQTIACGGKTLRDAVVHFLAQDRQLAIGENMAEQLVTTLLCVGGDCGAEPLHVSGKNAATGAPCTLQLSPADLAGAAGEPMQALEALVRSVMEHTPADLAADMAETGLLLYGGVARLRGLEQRMASHLGLPVQTARDPQLASLLGAAAALRPDLEFRKILVRP